MKSKKENLKYLLIAIVLIIASVAGIGLFHHFIIKGNLMHFAGNKFADQDIKTSVALIELHKIRYGKYPESLSDLKFTGDWDPIHTGSVTYTPSKDQMSYFVAVIKNELMNKDHVDFPAEFWQGTGFDPSLQK